MRSAFWVAVFGLACGCGGGQRRESTAAEPATPARKADPPATADHRPVIACFGDSLTAGFGLEAGQSFPEILQRELPRYRVVNHGVSGDTTQDGLARISLVLADKPALVVLEFGGNDGLRGVPATITEKNLAEMITQLQQSGARVVLAGITLPPNYGAEYIRGFEAIYSRLAKRYQTPLIPFLLEGVGGRPELMQRDGLHPNAAGARIVAATVLRAIRPLL